MRGGVEKLFWCGSGNVPKLQDCKTSFNYKTEDRKSSPCAAAAAAVESLFGILSSMRLAPME